MPLKSFLWAQNIASIVLYGYPEVRVENLRFIGCQADKMPAKVERENFSRKG